MTGVNLDVAIQNAFRVLVCLPQVYPNSPGVHVSSPHTLSVTPVIEYPENDKSIVGKGAHSVAREDIPSCT